MGLRHFCKPNARVPRCCGRMPSPLGIVHALDAYAWKRASLRSQFQNWLAVWECDPEFFRPSRLGPIFPELAERRSPKRNSVTMPDLRALLLHSKRNSLGGCYVFKTHENPAFMRVVTMLRFHRRGPGGMIAPALAAVEKSEIVSPVIAR